MARAKRVNIKLSDWAYGLVQELAEEDDRSISSYCQRVLEKHLGDVATDQEMARITRNQPDIDHTGFERPRKKMSRAQTKVRK